MVPRHVVVRDRAAALAQRQVRPQRCCARSWRREPATHRSRAFGSVDGQLAVGGVPLDRLAERVGSTPFFAYDRALLTERVAAAARDAARRRRPQLRGQGQPDAGRRPAPRRPRRLARRRLGAARCGSRSTRRCRADRVSFAGPGQDATPSSTQAVAAGVTIELESTTEAERVVAIGERARRPAAGRGAGQPRLRGQGLGHADGRRPAAVRRRRRARARRCSSDLAARRPRVPRASTSSPARRTCSAEILCEAQRKTVELALRLADDGAGAGALPQPRRRLRHPVLRPRRSRSTSPRSATNLAEPARPTRSARACPTRGS